jgi:glycosyltransferase involved in cell wall biosynthesis
VLAISHAAAEEIIEHYRVPRARVRVVPLGVDDEWFEPPSSAAIDALCRNHGVRRGCFFCVGTLQPRKNIGGLIAAYDGLPAAVRDAHQLIIAGRYGWGVAELKAELASRRPKGDVLWLDYVSPDELRALFAISCAFVFPTLAEGFGLPVLEAFASRTPVIASDLPALREIAASHAVLIPPGDVDCLGEAMSRIASGAPSHAELEDARLQARRFTWIATAHATLSVYAELV